MSALDETAAYTKWPVDKDPIFGCELWRGRRDPRDGRAMIWSGTLKSAYQVAWERKHGPLPKGKELDHACRRPWCVFEPHLELVTRSENERRKSWRYRSKRTQCRAGHDLKLYAMITPEGGRLCRLCKMGA